MKNKVLAIPVIRIASILFFFLCSACASGQTTNISGVVNTYHKVIQIIPSKACLRVADTTGLHLNSTVMIIQMKGATINISNSASYGDTISLNGAGSYEIGVVCFIIDDSVFLFHNLLNTYDTAGKVQIVQFGDYYSANVIDTVKAAPWDSAAGTGGVIAIYAEQDLTLNAPIYADSSGNRGGVLNINNAACPPGAAYFYDATVLMSQGAYKGEGVAAVAASADGGKGAPANGGGGGNGHNNSGGGGANLVAGGNGGANSSNGPFTCTIVGNNNGRAGRALSSWSGTKVFMGGGAGAGHSNNGVPTQIFGGNGGGLIFIWVNNLVGNNKIISANGGTGGPSQNDGAGGGGAGGTIIMNVTTYSGGLTVNSNGGNGGLSDDGSVPGRCFGGGGGGSGGAVYFSGSVLPITVSVNGGAGGAEINRDAGCVGALPGGAGNNGSVFSSYTFSRSTDPAGYCRFLLPSQLISFKVRMINKNILSEWRVLSPEMVKDFTLEKKIGNSWLKVNSIPAFGINENYSSIDDHPLTGINYYRLKIVERSNLVYYSEIRKVFVDLNDPGFTIYPNPASNQFFISGKINLPASLVLMDISGRVVWGKKILNIHSACILPKLPAGIYLLQCEQTILKLMIR